MALYPEVQKKAQAEIDAVVGPNRLPDFHDRPSLPYINAVVKESSRWNLAAPLGRLFLYHYRYHDPDEFRRYSTYVYYRR
jgi:cytochrome P450